MTKQQAINNAQKLANKYNTEMVVFFDSKEYLVANINYWNNRKVLVSDKNLTVCELVALIEPN